MRKFSFLIGAVLGGLTALIVAVLSALGGYLANLPNIPFNIFDWMARVLPGGLVTFFIEGMVGFISRLNTGQTSTIAKQAEQGTAVLTFIGVGVVFGLVLVLLGRRRPEQLSSIGIVGGLVLLVLMFVVMMTVGFPTAGPLMSAIWIAVILVGWGWILARLIQYLTVPAAPAVTDVSRRQFLTLVGVGSFAVLVTAAGVSLVAANANKGIPATGSGGAGSGAAGSSGGAAGSSGGGAGSGGGKPPKNPVAGAGATPSGPEAIVNASTTSGPARSPSIEALTARIPAAPGTRPEFTPASLFYRVDINTLAPEVDGASWKLEVKGLVDHPKTYSLADIRSKPAVSQAITLECISNTIGGDLISTGLWTGVRLKDILAEVGVKPGAQEIQMQAADGFYESLPMSEAMDERTLLVYEMDGQPLAAQHGFPLRIYIPNHYGMKQPKWLTSLEVINRPGTGFWVDRGWSQQATPQITSVIDTVNTNAYNPSNGTLPIGGIAYAGARGISKVEVKVDSGPWQAAQLRTPPLSPLTWVEWRYDWKAVIGEHSFQVRAYDGSGQPQVADIADAFPNGATGYYQQAELIPEGKKS